MVLSSQNAGLISVMCESVLVGAYGVLTGLVIWVLLAQRRTMPRMHRLLFSASVMMFAISATHLGLVMQARTLVGRKAPLANAQSQIILSMVQFVIGDLILVWRVWVIWGRNYWVPAVPLAIMISAAACTINIAFGSNVRKFFTVAPVVLIVANTSLCTILIAGRIWYMRYHLKKITEKAGISNIASGSKGALAFVIESGALYALCQLISLILDRTKSVGLTIILNLEIPLIGILPTLIIVLVHFDQLPGTRTAKDYVISRSLHFNRPESDATSETITANMRYSLHDDRDSRLV
ncbi:hypothetical protein Hypma_003234 [Hypsizygus marmoreus]|uniref:Uncharacterized protein n=1 Tax=Hypsizygus marmoreus TaxID=39966 RepID=A0A369K799_HYPMA|nr:hypothetical protein Hypma_003234 [Hypsizygus marmoreus]